MASNAIWYAGRRIKRPEHDKAVHLEAVAQLVDGKWRLIQDPETLFRHMNDVELRALDARQMKLSDWAAFTLGSKEPRAKSWPATAHRRLYRYMDLSSLGSAEQVQRQLVGDGVKTPHPSGVWMIRCAVGEVLQAELREAGGTAHLAPSNGKVQAYRFELESVIEMPTGDGEVTLYDLKGSTPTTVYDWAPDDAFALRVVRAAADAGDANARNLVAWLENHAKQAVAPLPVKVSDIVAANEALRSGKLAKRLAADQALLRTFLESLAVDERIRTLIKECSERVAEEERGAARARAEAQAKREMEASRKQRLATLEAELQKTAEERKSLIDHEHANRQKSLAEELKRLQADGEAELQRTIGVRSAAMQKLVEELEARSKSLGTEVAQLKTLQEAEREKAESLRAETAAAQSSLDAIQSEAAKTTSELAAERARLAAERMKCPTPTSAIAAKRLALDRAGAAIETSMLLSERGKVLMASFLALTLAGEVPALCGPGVDDFLLAAEIMWGAGRSVRMEADPTIITFEDLWIRAGTELRTGLGQALAISSGVDGKPRTTIAVVERAERSGARFWYPALADCAQRGDLPRRMLLCVTLEDPEREEAAEVLARAVRLDVSDVLAADAALALAMAAAAQTAIELDPGESRAEVTLGVAVVAGDVPRLGATRAARAMRAAAEATRLAPIAQPLTIVQLFVPTGTHPASTNKRQESSHA